MDSLQLSAKTVDEAVEVALAELGLSRSEVQVEVLKKGRGGILGLGAEEAVVRVTPLSEVSAEEGDAVQLAREALEMMLSLMRVPARVELRKEGEGEAATVVLDIRGDDLGILIGRRGETLMALQYLVNLVASRRLKLRAGVTVDVEGYRQRRYQALEGLAVRIAEKVRQSGHSLALEPMSPAERRIVHLALKDDPTVTTQSVGEGESRKVAIFPKGG